MSNWYTQPAQYDLTITYLQKCQKGIGQYKVQGKQDVYTVDITPTYMSCTCPDYIYRRRALGETCKHIDQVLAEGNVCGWDELISEERQSDAQLMERVCPRCGGQTTSYPMGV